MAMPSSHDVNAIPDFFLWLRTSRKKGTPNPPSEVAHDFIPQQKILEFFTNETRLKKMLRSLGEDNDLLAQLDTIRDRYSKIFLILFKMREEKLLMYFITHPDLEDNKLPFAIEPVNFPKIDGLFQRFREAQREFCAAIFRLGETDTNLGGMILPIVEKEVLRRGHNNTVSKVRLDHTQHQFYTPSSSIVVSTKFRPSNILD
jgi:hypothetical protein